MPAVPRVLICGAGLTGLTTAWHLRRSGIDVTLLEVSEAVGGVVQSVRRDGYLVERGPNSCTLTPGLASLLESLSLTPMLRPAAPQAQRRFIVRDGVPVVVPSSPGAMARSPLFSVAAKLRLLREPFITRRHDTGDESVADFVRRRLGHEPLDWAVDPFVSGVYAGDPERLSVRHAFPRLAALEREHGSLLRGMIAAGREAREARRAGETTAGRYTIVSFVDGMATLPVTLADRIGRERIQMATRVIGIVPRNGGVDVTVERGAARETLHADLVISTLPLHALGAITLPADTQAALTLLQRLQYPPVASLALGFRRADVAHALDGFGMLVPSREQRKTLGVLFSSTLFQHRAPADRVLLTCFLGGTRHPELGVTSTASLLDVVQPELAALLGVAAAPAFVEHTVWPRAIPQYELKHDEHLRAAESIEALVPGLLVDGQFRRGVSIGDCIAGAEQIAARALPAATAAAAARAMGAGDSAGAGHERIAIG